MQNGKHGLEISHPRRKEASEVMFDQVELSVTTSDHNSGIDLKYALFDCNGKNPMTSPTIVDLVEIHFHSINIANLR